jgi:predicted RNA binding protein YcfA (HicA-like mRNA interferase family)
MECHDKDCLGHELGSHQLFVQPTTKKEVWVAVHTKKDAGQLGNRILREAGIS